MRMAVGALVVLMISASTAVVQAATMNVDGLRYSSTGQAVAGKVLAHANGIAGNELIYVQTSVPGATQVNYYVNDPMLDPARAVAVKTAPFAVRGAFRPGVNTLLAEVVTANGVGATYFARFTVGAATAAPVALPTAGRAVGSPVATAPVANTGAGTGTAAAPTGVPAATGAADPSECTTTAADTLKWGQPTYQSNFNEAKLDPTWHPYGPEPGHNDNGVRTPAAITVGGGNVTITGDAQGNTGAMKWFPGQQYGRWEGCLKVSKENGYNALFLMWPDAEDFPVGGEIDWVEIFEERDTVNWFLHYGADNQQTSASTAHDTTQWTAYALEWTPTSMTRYINGKVTHTEKDPSIFPPRPMNMCIQLDNFGRGGTASMTVDWAKQWALPESKPSTLGLAPGDPATGHPGESPDKAPRAMTVAQMLGKAGAGTTTGAPAQAQAVNRN